MVLTDWEDYLLQAFWDLSTTRSHQISMAGTTYGPIPWNTIATYAERRRLEPDLSLAFEQGIRWLDGVYLKRKQSELEKVTARRSRGSRTHGNRTTTWK